MSVTPDPNSARPYWLPVGPLDEIPSDQLVSRTVASIDVLFIKSAEGLAAFRDRCPHRFAQLSLGKLEDGVIQCPYHGLRFNKGGQCVHNPHDDGPIPPTLKLSAFKTKIEDEHVFVCLDPA